MPFLPTRCKRGFNIDYKDTIPEKINFLKKNAEDIKKFITTKGKVWENEAELRLLACPNWLNLKNGGKDAILNVSDDAISEIIFGVGTPENVKNEVKNLVAKPDSKCRNAKLYQLEMRTDRYGFRKTDV